MAKPWKVVDLMTSEKVSEFETEVAAARFVMQNKDKALDIQYRPRATRAKKR